MCRNRHYRARAVAHQDIIRNENRDFCIVDRIDRTHAIQPDAGFALIQLRALKIGFACSLLAISAHGINVRQLFRPLFNRRMLRRNDHIGRTEKCIRAGGINGQLVAFRSDEINLRTGRPADPVFLLGFDTFNIIYLVQIVNQPLGVFGDFQHPLAFGAAHNLRTAALTNALYNFLIGEHALTGCAPVDRHFLFIRQPLFIKLEENPLRPFIVSRVRSADFTRPVKGQPKRLQLALKPGNIPLGNDCRMDMVFNRKIFGRQAERIPTHRIKHIITLHPLFPCHDIQRGIGTRMANMQPCAGRIRKLYKRVEFLFRPVL